MSRCHALIEQNDCDRVELEKVKQHYKELYDSIKINRAHTSEKTSTMLNEIESLKAQLRSKEHCLTSDYVKPKVLAPGMYAIDVKPIPHPLKNNRSAHLNYISHLKESVETVVQVFALVSGTQVAPSGGIKTYDRDRSKLMNSSDKFIGSCDLKSVLRGGTGPLYVSCRAICDSDLEVAFRKHTCFIRDLNGTDILKGSRGTNLYTISIDEMMNSSQICLLSKASKVLTVGGHWPQQKPSDSSAQITEREDLGKFQAKQTYGIFVGTRACHRDPGQLKSGLAPTDEEWKCYLTNVLMNTLSNLELLKPVPSASLKFYCQAVHQVHLCLQLICSSCTSTSASSSTHRYLFPVLLKKLQNVDPKNFINGREEEAGFKPCKYESFTDSLDSMAEQMFPLNLLQELNEADLPHALSG
ncbi:hypothetical protein Tco_0803243 [Tanacetum coccineum]|uniref:Uncharacterized protein n=1 Tax=Tanacetum coccineum TaxID=301880 RepID=A0ABQ5A203_9ASTR